MNRFLLVVALLAFIGLTYYGMHRAWQARLHAQSDIARPSTPLGGVLLAGPWTGTYLGASFADRWLDRVTAHTLGARSQATVALMDRGLDVTRSGTTSFGIPTADLIGVRADKGIAGRAYEQGGIVVVTFRLGETPVDIGFRFPSTEDHLAALAALAPEVTP